MAALSDIAKYVRPDVAGCPDILILDAILRAGKELCKKTKEVKQTISIVTVAGVANYSINTVTDTLPDEILSVNRTEFDHLTASSFKEFDDEGLNRLSGTPMFYYMEGENQLVLGMIPNAVEILEVTIKIRPTEDATTLPDELVTRYKDQIASKAKATLMLMKNQVWSDLELASIHEGLFNDAVADINWRNAKGKSRKPLRTRPSFF